MPFNIADDVWDRAVDEIREQLVAVARQGRTIPYSDLAQSLTTLHLTADARAFHEMLGDVSRRAFDRGEPLLSAIVVHKHDDKPGSGFCRMARGLGYEVEGDTAAEDAFSGREMERVWGWWRRR